MKLHHGFVLVILAVTTASAQTNTLPNSGNVGIGTTTPNNALQVVGDVTMGRNGGSTWYFQSPLLDLRIVGGTLGANFDLIPLGGNVGIGTTSPNYLLDVNGAMHSKVTGGSNLVLSKSLGASIAFDNDAGVQTALIESGSPANSNRLEFWTNTATNTGLVERMRIDNAGNVGIGTTSPGSLLEMKSAAPILTLNGTDNTQFKGINFATNGSVQANLLSNIQSGELKLQSGTSGFGGFITFNLDGNEKVRIQANTGNVGIGTTSPTEKLSVNGRIRAKEVIVETTGWSDHVFADSYKLQSLSEVEQHIKTEKHLPGVPSAQEVADKGVSVGDMQAILLAKIEELTLHQIAQEKEIARLREREATLTNQVQQLQQKQ
jgi:hypothetical protein